MMAFVDIIRVIDDDIAMSALDTFQRQVRSHAWQNFASALQSQDRQQVPSMVSGAIDGAFQLRMIALLERAQRADWDGRKTVSMSPALRAALDRYARFKIIEAGRTVGGRKLTDPPAGRQNFGKHPIVRISRELCKHALDWLQHWLARMRDRGR